MIIADLNYLENTSEEVLGGFSFSANKDVDIDINIDESVEIYKDVYTDIDLDDNVATAESGANAVGNNTLAEAFAFTYTDEGSSAANALSISATSD